MAPFTEFEDTRTDDLSGMSMSVPFCADMGIPVATAREAIYALARHAGYDSFTLIEWSGAEVSGEVVPGQDPLHYAVLLTGAGDDDVPVGLGDTQAAALSDLLWSLGTPVLLDALAGDDCAPTWLDAGADEMSASHTPPNIQH